MRIDSVLDVVVIVVTADHHVFGLIAVEAVPVVVELRIDQPAGWIGPVHPRRQRRRELRDRYAIRLRRGIAEIGDRAVYEVGQRANPGNDEWPEVVRSKERGVGKDVGSQGQYGW